MASALSTCEEVGSETGVVTPKQTQTVIRLKRRIDESPSKILVVSFKKQKTEGLNGSGSAHAEANTLIGVTVDDNEENGVCSRVLRLVGTVPDTQDANIAQTVTQVLETEKPVARKLQESSLRQNIKARRSKITEKTRQDVKQSSEESRFKMVASKRGISEGGLDQHENELFKLLDLVSESDVRQDRVKVKPEGFEPGNVTCNGKPMTKDSSVEQDYVYDLYISHDPCIEEFICDQFLSVEDGDDFMDDWRQTDNDEDIFAEEDEDSNAEDNWRNDYPDSDTGAEWGDAGIYSGGNSDMQGLYGAMKGVGLSDSSDDDIAYGVDVQYDEISFDKRYSKYKRRVADEYADEVVSGSSDSDNEDIYD